MQQAPSQQPPAAATTPSHPKLPGAFSSSSAKAAAAAAASTTQLRSDQVDDDVDAFARFSPAPVTVSSGRPRAGTASAHYSLMNPALASIAATGITSAAFMRLPNAPQENPLLKQLFNDLLTRMQGFVASQESAAVAKKHSEKLMIEEVKKSMKNLETLLGSNSPLSIPMYESYVSCFENWRDNANETVVDVVPTGNFLFNRTVEKTSTKDLPIKAALDRFIQQSNQYKADYLVQEKQRLAILEQRAAELQKTQAAEAEEKRRAAAAAEDEKRRKAQQEDEERRRKAVADEDERRRKILLEDEERRRKMMLEDEERRRRAEEENEKRAKALAEQQQEQFAKQLEGMQVSMQSKFDASLHEAAESNKAAMKEAVEDASRKSYTRGQDDLMNEFVRRLQHSKLPRGIKAITAGALQITQYREDDLDVDGDFALDVRRAPNGHMPAAASFDGFKTDDQEKEKGKAWFDINFPIVEKLVEYGRTIERSTTVQAQVEKRVINLIIFKLGAEKHTKSGEQILNECREIFSSQLGVTPESNSFTAAFKKVLLALSDVAFTNPVAGNQTLNEIMAFRQLANTGLYFPKDATALNYYAGLETNHSEFTGSERVPITTIDSYVQNFVTKTKAILGFNKSSMLPAAPASASASVLSMTAVRPLATTGAAAAAVASTTVVAESANGAGVVNGGEERRPSSPPKH